MTTTLVNSGVYDAHEVAYLLGGRRVEQVIRWSTPDSKGNPPMVTPSHIRTFSFIDLVSLAVVAEICQRRVPEIEVRRGIQFLSKKFASKNPLASQKVTDSLATSGKSFLTKFDRDWLDIGKSGQGVFEEIIRVYLRKISYDDLGVAAIWKPTPHVVLDPRVQAGTPCIEGTRIPTATIAELLEDESAAEIAKEYGVTVKQVKAAEKFERQLSSGIGLAA